jgi:hypothetical protein
MNSISAALEQIDFYDDWTVSNNPDVCIAPYRENRPGFPEHPCPEWNRLSLGCYRPVALVENAYTSVEYIYCCIERGIKPPRTKRFGSVRDLCTLEHLPYDTLRRIMHHYKGTPRVVSNKLGTFYTVWRITK